MEWIRENLAFLVFFIIFVTLHLFGHGHGGRGEEEHKGRRPRYE